MLLEEISTRSKINTGFIRKKVENNACVLTISNINSLKYIITLMSPYLRTPKINQVNKLIDWINKKENRNDKYLILCKNSLDADSWLAVFIDADGSFHIRYTTRSSGLKERITMTFTLEQRLLDPISGISYENIMLSLAQFLHIKVNKQIQNKTNNEYWRIVSTSKLSLNILIKYLSKNSLLSSKYLNYKDWEKAALLFINGTHTLVENKKIIFNLKNGMNNKRTIYTWDHLNLI